MPSKSVLPVRPTAKQVRQSVLASGVTLSEKAAHTLTSRGRLHPEVVVAYNKGKRPEKRYVVGNSLAAKADAQAFRAKVIAAGGGKRGPIAKSVLAQVKG